MADVNVNEVVLRSPGDLVKAIDAMLIQMDRKQRKSFLQWVKQKRQSYDFSYPQGYVPKESQDAGTTAKSQPVVNTDLILPEPGIGSPISPANDGSVNSPSITHL